MADVNISKFRASVVRDGSKPASPGFVVSEGQDPVNPPGTNNYVPYTGATANVELGEYGVEAGFITLDTTPTNTPTDQGTIFWDADDETVDIVLNGYTMKIGEDLFYPVKNQTGSTIAKGVAVRFNGTVGNSGRLLIAPFIADGSVPSSRFMGVTAEEILNGEDGKVLYFGRVRGINTNAFNEGDILYASTTSAGGYQTAIPVAPNNIVQVAAVVTKSATVGTIFVRPTLGSNINKDEGVKIVSVADKNLLQYQIGTSLWENKSLAQILGGTTAQYIRGDGSLATLPTGGGTVTSVGLSSATSGVTIGSSPVTTSGTITLAIATASGSQNGLLSSTDWTTFNSKQNALTNPVTGTGVSGRVAFWNGTNSITSDSDLLFDGSNLTVGGNLILANGANRVLRIGSLTNYNYDLAVNGEDFQIIEAATTPRLTIKYPNGNVLINTTTDAGYKLDVNGTGRFSGQLTSGSTTAGFINAKSFLIGTDGTETNYRYQFYLSSNDLKLYSRGYGDFLTINYSTGAATFSSSITSTLSSGIFFNNSSGGTNATQIRINNTSGDLRLGIESSTGQTIQLGTLAYAAVFGNQANNAVQFTTNGTARVTILGSGNVGIGTPTPNSILEVKGSSPFIRVTDTAITSEHGLIFDATGGFVRGGLTLNYSTAELRLHVGVATNTYFQTFYTNGVERARITSGGFFKASNTGTYASSTGTFHELMNSATGNNIVYLYNTAASPYGPYVRFSGATPNNGSNYYFYCDDSSNAARFIVYSNGGISNYQANNTNLSDERTKKEIAPLESYWDKFKAIEIVKFKYKDQTHDDFNIGVIAQQVEKVAPEFVDVDGWDNKTEGNEVVSQEEPIKSIYTADLHHATIKVLQEAMEKIESMQKEIDTLKN